jgi:hypothetical protein
LKEEENEEEGICYKDENGPTAKKRRVQNAEVNCGQKDESTGQYICNLCDKSFNKQSSLTRHKYEHSGEEILRAQFVIKFWGRGAQFLEIY